MPNADTGVRSRRTRLWTAARFAAFLIAALVLLSLSAHAQGTRRVRAIHFDIGPHGQVSEASLRDIIRLSVGDDYDEIKAETALMVLLETGYFERDREASYYDVAPLGADVAVTFHLTEHPIITSIVIEGNTVVGEEELVNALSEVINVGEVLNDKALGEWVDDVITQAYVDHGFFAITLRPFYGEQGVITIPIVEGYVEEIRIEGLDKTKEHVVRREIHTRPGQLLDANSVRDDQSRLMNVGIFDDIQASDLPGEELGGVILVYNMVERKTGYLSVGAGFSTREGFLGYAEVAETNLRGEAQRLALRAEFGSFMNFDFSFFEPYLDSHHTSLEVNLFRNAYRTGARGFGGGLQNFSAESRSGIRLGLNRPLDDDYKQNVNLSYRNETTRNYDPRLVNLVSSDLLRGRVGALRLAYIHDTRDYFENPSDGGWYSASLEQAATWLGGRSSFSKLDLDVRQYFQAGDKGVFALRASYGSTLGTTPPVYEAYRVGGAETLRGYREDRWWGLRRMLASAEYRYRISGDSPSSGVQLVLFADYGDAYGGRWQSSDGSVLFSEHQNFAGSFGYGVGVRVNTPLGPIRLDYGLGSEGGRTHFGISQTF